LPGSVNVFSLSALKLPGVTLSPVITRNLQYSLTPRIKNQLFFIKAGLLPVYLFNKKSFSPELPVLLQGNSHVLPSNCFCGFKTAVVF